MGSGVRTFQAPFCAYATVLNETQDHHILTLLELTLTRNDFLFNNQYFLQMCGCAMGRKYSPSYADIYLAEWEHSALQKCKFKPLLYLRYLDDIFGLWDQSEAAFQDFLQTLNVHHNKIKLKPCHGLAVPENV